MTFLHDDDTLVQLLINSGMLHSDLMKYAQEASNISGAVNKLLNNLESRLVSTRVGYSDPRDAELPWQQYGQNTVGQLYDKDLSSLNNLLDYLYRNTIKYGNFPIVEKQGEGAAPHREGQIDYVDIGHYSVYQLGFAHIMSYLRSQIGTNKWVSFRINNLLKEIEQYPALKSALVNQSANKDTSVAFSLDEAETKQRGKEQGKQKSPYQTVEYQQELNTDLKNLASSLTLPFNELTGSDYNLNTDNLLNFGAQIFDFMNKYKESFANILPKFQSHFDNLKTAKQSWDAYVDATLSGKVANTTTYTSSILLELSIHPSLGLDKVFVDKWMGAKQHLMLLVRNTRQLLADLYDVTALQNILSKETLNAQLNQSNNLERHLSVGI